MAASVQVICPGFVAQVIGVDPREPVTSEDVATI